MSIPAHDENKPWTAHLTTYNRLAGERHYQNYESADIINYLNLDQDNAVALHLPYIPEGTIYIWNTSTGEYAYTDQLEDPNDVETCERDFGVLINNLLN